MCERRATRDDRRRRVTRASRVSTRFGHSANTHLAIFQNSDDDRQLLRATDVIARRRDTMSSNDKENDEERTTTTTTSPSKTFSKSASAGTSVLKQKYAALMESRNKVGVTTDAI